MLFCQNKTQLRDNFGPDLFPNISVAMATMVATKKEMANMMTLHGASLDPISEVF